MNCSDVGPTPVVDRCNITLNKQHSQAKCESGTSFGCYDGNATMWTDKGCRGEFACDGLDKVTCDVMGDGRHFCTCAKPGPVTCKGWISDLQKKILLNTEVIAINQDVTPQGRPVTGSDSDLTVWARHLSDGSAAVALYNQDDKAVDLSVDFAKHLGWDAATKATVRDLWAKSDAGTFTGKYPASPVTVAPHEAKLVRITKA